jgi:hypothetical protein
MDRYCFLPNLASLRLGGRNIRVQGLRLAQNLRKPRKFSTILRALRAEQNKLKVTHYPHKNLKNLTFK